MKHDFSIKFVSVRQLVRQVMSLFLTGLLILCCNRVALSAQDTEPDADKQFFDYPAVTGNILPTADSPPVTGNLIHYGNWLYRGLCIRCHGKEGDGEGADWTLTDYNPEFWLPRQPRNFQEAVFKVRSTPSGSLPQDRDLFEAISRGLDVERDMPSFSFLPERDRWALVAYIKTFSETWVEDADDQEPAVQVDDPPPPSEAIIIAGKATYEEMKCAKCHGKSGTGDGPSANELEDDSGLPIVPRDFTDPSQFIGPSDAKGIYRTFTTGLDGTPMPSYADFLDEDQRWQLVWYVMSLRPNWDIEVMRQSMMPSK
jgi:mono/diheme cytochrome c family protein